MGRCWRARAGGHRGRFCSDCIVERRAQPGPQFNCNRTEWTHPPGSLRVNMSRLLRRVNQREGYAFSAGLTTEREPQPIKSRESPRTPTHGIVPSPHLGSNQAQRTMLYSKDWYVAHIFVDNCADNTCAPHEILSGSPSNRGLLI